MREILFRGKSKDNGEWVYGTPLYATSYHYGCEFTLIVPIPVEFSGFELDDFEDVIPETVGQFTGLLDKHGNKIFEGDVVKNSCCVTLRSGDNENKWDCTIMGVVTFREGGFWVKSSEFDFPVSNEYEVIGNIHDNKLEEQE